MENLSEILKKCIIFVINGETYFGKVTVDREVDTLKVVDAVESSKGDFKTTVKSWIKSKNSGKLETFTVTGLSTLTQKPLTKEQSMKIDSIAAQAVYIMENTLSDLQNDKIDQI